MSEMKLFGGEDSMMGWIRCETCGKVKNRIGEPRCHCSSAVSSTQPTPPPQSELEKAIEWVDNELVVTLLEDICQFKRDIKTILTAAKLSIELRKELDEALEANKRANESIGIQANENDKMHLAKDALIERFEKLLSHDVMWLFSNVPPISLRADYNSGGSMTHGPNNCKEFFDMRNEFLQLCRTQGYAK